MVFNFHNIACLAIVAILSVCSSVDYFAATLIESGTKQERSNVFVAGVSATSQGNVAVHEPLAGKVYNDAPRNDSPTNDAQSKLLEADSDFRATLLLLASMYGLAIALPSKYFQRRTIKPHGRVA